ncbi:DUF4019 domain-containing protein [Nitrosomonas sp.]|uniref:DUF4019 domain-containing protein n=1 Tax=Nitrosomonas sp. TaxID=42353 RepID=UPI001D35BBE9|nr:DUF4019 domain-containing protein [Nitrosomonas sp.]MBX3616892.1 DUF4019 domain-containing protein [Nitrosomonas sp.]
MKQWLLLLVLFFGCGLVQADDSATLKIVESTARSWFKLVDDGQYKEGWEMSSTLFKTKTPEAQWIKSITEIRILRGAMTARYIATAGVTKSVSGFPDGEYIVLQFYTTFAEKGLAMETVTLVKIAENTWQIADYAIK